jgi:hypothetical protein
VSAEKPTRPYRFCYVCAQAVSVNIHGGATAHLTVTHDRLCPGSEVGMDLTIEARDARVKREAAADALDAVIENIAATPGCTFDRAMSILMHAATEQRQQVKLERIRAAIRDLVLNGDLTPAGARVLERVIDDEERNQT